MAGIKLLATEIWVNNFGLSNQASRQKNNFAVLILALAFAQFDSEWLTLAIGHDIGKRASSRQLKIKVGANGY